MFAWLIDNYHLVLFFLISVLLGHQCAKQNKKKKSNIDSNGLPLNPKENDTFFNAFDRTLYVYHGKWIPVKTIPKIFLHVTSYYSIEDKHWKAMLSINFDGYVEDIEYWGETEEIALSKACGSVTHKLLSKINDK